MKFRKHYHLTLQLLPKNASQCWDTEHHNHYWKEIFAEIAGSCSNIICHEIVAKHIHEERHQELDNAKTRLVLHLHRCRLLLIRCDEPLIRQSVFQRRASNRRCLFRSIIVAGVGRKF